MNTLPTLSQLQAFITILKHGSFRKAAKALDLTQPAITYSINSLEKNLGVLLFIRKGNGVNLTKAGEFFSERAKILLDTYSSVVNDIKAISDNKNAHVLTLGVSSFSLFSSLSSKISNLQTDFPSAKIEIIEGELSTLLRMLRTGQIDIIIHPDSIHLTNCDFIEKDFFKTRVCILARKENPLINAKSITELNNAEWFLTKSKLNYFNNLKSDLKNKIKNDSLVLSGDGIMSLLMTLNSDFITLVPEVVLKKTPLIHDLQEIKIKEPLPDISYKIVLSRYFPLKESVAELVFSLQENNQKTH
ncbi:LysR family transcriptional regulator [Serratia fonticola]|uniref:LysR family transcriptional regulator n=1 Tax=Serratia fonticola TaxID=47917 RepID=UPI0015C5B02B|nr:LysR family transcriptional regulator [Serratia fonticola]MBC3378336.1 LysR family transcriptional regulator [Serratia fonticola]NYA37536.1 LysR family transcriptional regulator [Serratia fonticola]